VDGCVVEERVTRLRHAHEEARFGVETGVEEEGCRRAERRREASLERGAGVVMDEALSLGLPVMWLVLQGGGAVMPGVDRRA
jgi:hypothetical protein